MKIVPIVSLILFSAQVYAQNDPLMDLINQKKMSNFSDFENQYGVYFQDNDKDFIKNNIYEPSAYAVYDFRNNEIMESKNINMVRPIASVTKLMTANVFLKLNNGRKCYIDINEQDKDTIKGTKTRLPKNTPIECNQLLKAMLISSDNYAASALSRSIPNMSKWGFVQEMNRQAKEWGMNDTHFSDSSGLSPNNVSSVADLITLSKKSMEKHQIKNISSYQKSSVNTPLIKIGLNNSNKLIRNGEFSSLLSKTGYIREAGYNLVFVNGRKCIDRIIGVISLNNASSERRALFTKQKLNQYNCF